MGRPTPPWYPEARKLRRLGWPRAAIAKKFGVTIHSVAHACTGIKCPIDHRAVKAFELMQAKNADPEFQVANATRSRQRMTTQRKDRAYIEKLSEGFQTYRQYRAARKRLIAGQGGESDGQALD